MSPAAIVTLCGICATVGFVVGWVCGETTGRDAQWCDDFINAGRRERERRDSRGRFKKHSTQTHYGNNPHQT
jgi:hypothetical protein